MTKKPNRKVKEANRRTTAGSTPAATVDVSALQRKVMVLLSETTGTVINKAWAIYHVILKAPDCRDQTCLSMHVSPQVTLAPKEGFRPMNGSRREPRRHWSSSFGKSRTRYWKAL